MEDLYSIATAIRDSFNSPNVLDSNLEMANIIDVIHHVAMALEELAMATKTQAKATREAGELIADAIRGSTFMKNE